MFVPAKVAGRRGAESCRPRLEGAQGGGMGEKSAGRADVGARLRHGSLHLRPALPPSFTRNPLPIFWGDLFSDVSALIAAINYYGEDRA